MPRHDMQQLQTLRIDNRAFFAEVGRCLAEGKSVVVMATGNSMEPFFESHKHELRLRACAPGEPRRGDVVVALTRGGDYVVHRVVGFGAGGDVALCGDGCADGRGEWAARDGIVGIVSHYRCGSTGKFKSLATVGRRLSWRLWPRPGRARRLALAIHHRILLRLAWRMWKPEWMRECYRNYETDKQL